MDCHKYLVIVDYIKNLINNGEVGYGEKIMSENELAKLFNISRQTVRQAIGILQNEGWLYRVKGSGTFIGKVIEREKATTHNIGVIITYPDEYIFPTIIKGIESVLSANGYTMILGFTSNKVEKEAQCLKSFIGKDIDGLIIESTKSAFPNPNIDYFHILKEKGIPFVFINGLYKELPSSYVVMDDERGGYLAAEFLIENGHKKIGGIFKSDDIQGHNRYKGYISACHKKGLEIAENSILWFTTEDYDTVFSEEYGKLLIKRFKDCSAVICYNDQIAVRLCDIMQSNGLRIPDDISVISFDDSSLAQMSSVKLTTVAHAGQALGENASYALLKLIKSGEGTEMVIKPSLVVRNSVLKIE